MLHCGGFCEWGTGYTEAPRQSSLPSLAFGTVRNYAALSQGRMMTIWLVGGKPNSPVDISLRIGHHRPPRQTAPDNAGRPARPGNRIEPAYRDRHRRSCGRESTVIPESGNTERRDVMWLDSHYAYNDKVGLAIVCPITNQKSGTPAVPALPRRCGCCRRRVWRKGADGPGR